MAWFHGTLELRLLAGKCMQIYLSTKVFSCGNWHCIKGHRGFKFEWFMIQVLPTSCNDEVRISIFPCAGNSGITYQFGKTRAISGLCQHCPYNCTGIGVVHCGFCDGNAVSTHLVHHDLMKSFSILRPQSIN